MFSRKSLSNSVLAAAIAVAGAAAFVSSPAEAGGSCSDKGKKSEFKEVKDACAKSLNATKKMMKQIEKAAKAKGDKTKCSDCHSDQKTYPLKDNAKEDYKKWRKHGGY